MYGTPLLVMIGLWAANQGIGFLLSPRIGKLVDKVGERKILTLYYFLVTLFFVGYAFLKSKHLLYAVFVADGATFPFAAALTTYVNKIAPPAEHTPTLSMGVAFNHVASVAMPFLGGVLWATMGYQWAFLIGLPAAAASILMVQRLPGRGASALDRPFGRTDLPAGRRVIFLPPSQARGKGFPGTHPTCIRKPPRLS